MNKTLLILIPFLALAFLTNCSARKTTPTPNPLTTDIGVTINGITWATRNVDAPGTFTTNPEDAGMFFQWNRRKGWSAIDRYVEGWDSSMPEGTAWYAENDPCPEGWRVPTYEELKTLVYVDSEWTTRNGVRGSLFGVAPYQMFLPAVGVRIFNNSEHLFRHTHGIYWSSTVGYRRTAERLTFNSGIRHMGINNRANGLSIRCVKIK